MTSLRHNGSPDARTDAYLDAARACLMDVGWRRTTLTEVARRAGVSRMTIYRTWSDMPQLLADLMTREWGDLVAATLAGQPPSDHHAERLTQGVVATVAALRDNDLLVRIVELDPELVLPYLFSRRGRSQEAIAQVLATLLAEGQAAGEIRAGDPTTMARSLLLACHGFVFSALTMVDDHVDEAALDAELRLLVERSLRP